MPIAHPLTGSPPLPVPPLVLAAVAVVLAAVVATRVRARPGAFAEVREPGWLWVPRLASAALVLLLVAVARGGPVDEPRNLAAVAVVHLAWPLLLVAAVLVGPLLWRAVDPWRALGSVERLFGAPPPGGPAASAAPPAAPPGAPGAPPPPGAVRSAQVPGGPAAAPGASPPSAAASAGASAAPPPSGGATAAAPGASGVAGSSPPAVPPGAGGPGTPTPSGAGDAPAVWPAVVTGGVWAVFLGWYTVSYEPRALATVLGAYTVVLVAGCIALGRARWLAAADAAGLLVSWAGLLRRGRLAAWSPPRGAAVLLGAAFGGVAFARLRLSGLWGSLGVDPASVGAQRAGAVAAVVLGGVLAYAADRWAARRGAPGSVAAALVPVVAATAVAATLRRALVAAQLLPALATDPFARGWRLLGPLGAARAVDVNPWGTGVQQALAATVVALGGVAGAWVVARRVRGVRARDPAALAVYVTTFAAVLLVTTR